MTVDYGKNAMTTGLAQDQLTTTPYPVRFRWVGDASAAMDEGRTHHVDINDDSLLLRTQPQYDNEGIVYFTGDSSADIIVDHLRAVQPDGKPHFSLFKVPHHGSRISASYGGPQDSTGMGTFSSEFALYATLGEYSNEPPRYAAVMGPRTADFRAMINHVVKEIILKKVQAVGSILRPYRSDGPHRSHRPQEIGPVEILSYSKRHDSLPFVTITIVWLSPTILKARATLRTFQNFL